MSRTFWLLLALFIAALWLPHRLDAQSTNRAGLVIAYGEGQASTYCVSFSESSISGLELLQRAGVPFEVEVGGVGAAVCSIDGVGCPATDCFCQCSGNSCSYWSYWHLLGGAWQFSGVGADAYQVENEAVDGWSWGSGNVGSGSEPPLFTFDQICGSQTEPTATPTNTPTPVPTDTPVPTATPEPFVQFSAETNTLSAGDCTTLTWQTANVQQVFLNEQGVVGNGNRTVCPDSTTTYNLRVVHAGGEETHSVTITITAPTATPVPPATATPIPTAVIVTATAAATRPPATNSPTAIPPSPSAVPTGQPTATPTINTPTAVSPTAVPTSAPVTASATAAPAAIAQVDEATAEPTPSPLSNTIQATEQPTEPPSSEPSATATVRVVLLPTVTQPLVASPIVPTATPTEQVQVAEMVATEVVVQPNPVETMPDDTTIPLNYVAFGLVVTCLGGLFVVRQRGM